MQSRVVVVLVVINALYASLSLKIRPKERKLQPSTTGRVVVCERTLSGIISIVEFLRLISQEHFRAEKKVIRIIL